MHILFITTTLPHRLTNGGEIATQNLIDGIEQCGHRVEVLGYTRLGDRPATQPHFHSAREWPIETELAGLRKWKWLAEAVLTDAPYVCVKFKTAAMREAARALCREHRFDAVIIDHFQLAWLADEDFLPARRIGVAHNVEHQILAIQAAEPSNSRLKRGIFSRDARRMKAIEAGLVRSLSQVWVLTEEERASLSDISGRADGLHVLPLAGQGFATAGPLPAPDIDVVILGSWLWEVNRKGLEWFMAEVAPLLPGDLRVVIGGKGSDTVPNIFPNISYAGFVPDAAEFLRRGKVICIPSVMGAGIQLKTIEGIGIGRPIVTTRLGLRGIGDTPSHVTPVTNASEMAETIKAMSKAECVDHSAQAGVWAKDRTKAFHAMLRNSLAAL